MWTTSFCPVSYGPSFCTTSIKSLHYSFSMETIEVDLNLYAIEERCIASEYVEEKEVPPLSTCQICFDVFGYYDLIRFLCGSDCKAEICLLCLEEHITASVYSYYAGVLPKVRCPSCLVLLNKAQWSPYIINNDDRSHVLEKYATLCNQSCGFQSPCCHNVSHTMLPKAFKCADDEPETEVPETAICMIPMLRDKVQGYAQHRVYAKELLAFITEHFPMYVEPIFKHILRCLQDEERRANLLLYELNLHSNTYTTCCKWKVCFKCKEATHHAKCRDFLEDNSILICPSCRVTLVKVDGCNSVTCVCGESLKWRKEAKKQSSQRKQLVPIENYEFWYRWKRNLDTCMEDFRLRLLERHINKYRSGFKRMFNRAIRRARLRLIIKEYRTSFVQMVRRFRDQRQKKIREMNQEEQGEQVRFAPAA